MWVGRGQDLELTAEGIAQGTQLGASLRALGIQPAVMYAGPLRRTRRYAQVVGEALGLTAPAIIDARLAEIDYGQWGGLSDSEIRERFGSAELDAWTRESRWPASGAWASKEHEIREGALAFARERVEQPDALSPILAVASNGCMRYFLQLCEGEFERRAAAGKVKVRTGSVCKLVWDGVRFSVAYWDKRPEELQA